MKFAINNMVDFTKLFETIDISHGKTLEFPMDILPTETKNRSLVFSGKKVEEVLNVEYVVIPVVITKKDTNTVACLLLEKFLETKTLRDLKENQCVILHNVNSNLYGIAILGVEEENE